MRYPTVNTREYGAFGHGITFLGVVIVGFLAFMWYEDPEAPLGGALVFLGIGLALAVVGQGVARHSREVLEVDVDARRAVLHGGDGNAAFSLDDLPLRAVVHEHEILPNERRTIPRISYWAVPGPHDHVGLYASKHYPHVRRWAKRVAHDWQVPLVALDGTRREPGELDRPFWDVADPTAPWLDAPPPGDLDGVTMTETPDATVFTSARPLRATALPNPLAFLAAGFAGVVLIESPLVEAWGERALGVFELAIAAGLALVILVPLVLLAFGIRRALLPNAVRVTDTTVEHRGRVMTLDEVEEVVYVGVIRLIGHRRSIELPGEFCALPAVQVVTSALRRAIHRHGSRGTRAGRSPA